MKKEFKKILQTLVKSLKDWITILKKFIILSKITNFGIKWNFLNSELDNNLLKLLSKKDKDGIENARAIIDLDDVESCKKYK